MQKGKPLIIPYDIFMKKMFKGAIIQLFKYIEIEDEEDDDSCWIWTHKLYPDGKTYAEVKNIRISAKRLSYLTFKGPIDQGLGVRNTCKDPQCVNPDHLYLASTGLKYSHIEDAKKYVY